MPTITLVPATGQTNVLGSDAVVKFKSPNAPTLAVGDKWSLRVDKGVKDRGEVGHQEPWANSPTYDGSTDDDGFITFAGACTKAGSITDAPGFILAVGILPTDGDFDNSGQPGKVQIFGRQTCQLVPAGPPPAAPVLGLDNLIAAVNASHDTHERVADLRLDFANVSYLQQAIWQLYPLPVNVNTDQCLNDEASARIVSFLGGTVQKEQAPASYVPFLAKGTPWPLVNWIYATINGVPSKAVAADVAHAFDLSDLKQSITAAFKPV